MKSTDEKKDTNIYCKLFLLDEFSFDLILFCFKNLLANSYSVKCICDNSEVLDSIEFTKCASLILDEFIIKNNQEDNSYYNFLKNSIKNFHNTHICSTKTATIFSILLWKNLKKLSDHNSFLEKKFSKYLRIVLDECIDYVKLELVQILPIKRKKSKSIKITSRYLCSSTDINFNLNENVELYKNIINGITRNQEIFSKLIFDYLTKLNEANFNFNFEDILIRSVATSKTKIQSNKFTNQIHTNNSSEFCYEILRGIVVQVDPDENLEMMSKLNENETLNCLFFESSLTTDYSHLGYNKFFKCDFIISSDLFEYNQQENYSIKWYKTLKEILISNNIKLIFVRDNIDKNLKNFLKSNNIISISKLDSNKVKWLKEDLKCSSMAYVEQFDKHKIFKCKINFIDYDNLKFNYLNIQPFDEQMSKKYTILIETRLNNQTNMYVEYLRHCLKRLHNILNNNGEYLVGFGYVEKKLADILTRDQKLNSSKSFFIKDDEKIYYEMIKEIYSKTFLNYYQVVLSNSIDEFSINELIYFDDCISKFESWKTACLINQTLINSEFSCII